MVSTLASHDVQFVQVDQILIEFQGLKTQQEQFQGG